LILWGRDRADVLRVPSIVADAPIGDIAWAPDGQSLAYLPWNAVCLADDLPRVVRLDLPAGHQTILLDTGPAQFSGLRWDTPGELSLFDTDGQLWLYDLATKVLVHAPS
jgi:hypothetical protein